MQIQITDRKITQEQLEELCKFWFGDMVKIVVDIENGRIAVGGELHADAEQLLFNSGSRQDKLWGANFYPWNPPQDRIEYTALINIRPHADNLSMEIEDQKIRDEIKRLVEGFLLKADEELV